METPISYPKIEADKINNPIQLMAVWFAVLILTNASLLLAIPYINDPTITRFFSYSVIGFVLLFAGMIFFIQIKHRQNMLDDGHYLEYARLYTPRKVENKLGDEPGAVFVNDTPIQAAAPAARGADPIFTLLDQKQYPSVLTESYFLLHSAKMITAELVQDGKVVRKGLYTVRIWLENYDKAELKNCEKVYYRLFTDEDEYDFEENVVVTKSANKEFELWFNAYGEFNIVAVLVLKDGRELWLTRYLDLPGRPIA